MTPETVELIDEVKLMAGDVRNLRTRQNWSEEVEEALKNIESSIRHFIVDMEMSE